MGTGFVVAKLDEAGKPVGFLSNGGFEEAVTAATFFPEIGAARYELGRAYSSDPGSEYAVKPATMSITLA